MFAIRCVNTTVIQEVVNGPVRWGRDKNTFITHITPTRPRGCGQDFKQNPSVFDTLCNSYNYFFCFFLINYLAISFAPLHKFFQLHFAQEVGFTSQGGSGKPRVSDKVGLEEGQTEKILRQG